MRAQLEAHGTSTGSNDESSEAAFIDDIVEGASAAARGRTTMEVQIALSLAQSEFDDATAEQWRAAIVGALGLARELLGYLLPPSVDVGLAAELDGVSGPLDDPGVLANPEHAARGTGVQISEERFAEVVDEVVASLPPPFDAAFKNVSVDIANNGIERGLYGLYHGVPLTKKHSNSVAMPDRITIFRDAICRSSRSEEEARRRIRQVVLHEIGHYFGINDRRLRELGW